MGVAGTLGKRISLSIYTQVDEGKEDKMKITIRYASVSLLLTVVLLGLSTKSVAAPQRTLPNPVLYLLTTETVTTNGKAYIRYLFDVDNKDSYPAAMFAAAPSLPPCGSNTKASRTWVAFFDQSGKQLNNFCGLGKPADLRGIWFALEENAVPPSWIYIEINDRETNVKYKSNLADTTM